MPEEMPKKGKNIVLCCDGTGNEFIATVDPEKSNSNVVKLYTSLIVDNDQVAYYHPGVGTAGDPSAKLWISKQWSKLCGLAFASGFKANVLDAYAYLMENYNDGDRVYLFGFSRGAYTVRALAGLLRGYGLLCKGNEGHLPYAWNAYVRQHGWLQRDIKKGVKPNERFKETFSRKNFEICFMGIWDTVSSVGWVYTPLRLYSVAQNPIIRKGRHAISIDERRCFYRDNLWDNADDMERVTNLPAPDAPPQDLLQLWFAGVHSDVGGSYGQLESGLSNRALAWMLQEAHGAGVTLKPAICALVLGEDARPTGEPPTDLKIAELLPIYPKPTEDTLHRSLKCLWWVLEVLPHRYYDKDGGKEQWRIPFGISRRIPRGSFLHASARNRIEAGTDGYAPANIAGGTASLRPVEVVSQPGELVYVYEPLVDSQPVMNRTPVRWTVNVIVCVVEIVLAALLLFLLLCLMSWLRRSVLPEMLHVVHAAIRHAEMVCHWLMHHVRHVWLAVVRRP